MNPQRLHSPVPLPAGLLHATDDPTAEWNSYVEHAWNNTSEGRPHPWQLGWLLTRDILSSLIPAPLWRMRQWRDD